MSRTCSLSWAWMSWRPVYRSVPGNHAHFTYSLTYVTSWGPTGGQQTVMQAVNIQPRGASDMQHMIETPCKNNLAVS